MNFPTKCPVCLQGVHPGPGVTLVTLEVDDEDFEIETRALFHDACCEQWGEDRIRVALIQEIKRAMAMTSFMETSPQVSRDRATLN
jgi:hypothetical protein